MTAHSQNPAAGQRYNGFWPLLLVSISVLCLLGWEVYVQTSTRQNTEQLRDQQLRVVDQARRTQAGLEKLLHGLLDLAPTDEAAKRIVERFRIKQGSSPTPAPAP